MAGENLVRFVGPDLADENVAPADLATVRLQFNRPRHRDRMFAVVIVFQQCVIDDELAVEPHADPRADHHDPKRIPLSELFVREHQRIFARCAGTVVP